MDFIWRIRGLTIEKILGVRFTAIKKPVVIVTSLEFSRIFKYKFVVGSFSWL